MIPDEELYRRWLSGDEEGLRALMERYGDRLTLYLDGYVRDLHEGEDLMIEAFAWIIAKRPAIRAGGFRAYLFQAGRRMALRQAKSAAAAPAFPWRSWSGSRRALIWWRSWPRAPSGPASSAGAWRSSTAPIARLCFWCISRA